MVPGRGGRRSMLAAVRRNCGAESELENGEVGRGQCVQLKTRRKNHHRHTNSSPDEYESWRRSSSGGMHDARTSACGGLTLDRSILLCSTATSPTGLCEGFCVGLKDSVA